MWVPKVVATTGPLPECHGNNGPDGVNCARAVCSGTNGPMDGHTGTPCTREEPASVPHYNTDPVAGRPYQTTGDISPTHPPDAAAAGATTGQGASLVQFDKSGYPDPEKVLVLDPKIARTHTTFYSQQP